MLKYPNRLFLLFIFLGSTFAMQAQFQTSDENTPKDNSPYSRIGLGDLVNQNFVASRSMGGLGATFNDPFHSNTVNPASLAYLKATSFEIGGTAQFANLSGNGSEDVGIWSGGLHHMSLSFPIRNPVNEVLDRKNPKTHWGMNISLIPYTTVGYDITGTNEIVQDSTSTITNFNGRGGTYKIQWGNGVKYKDFSLGVTIGHRFGKIINERDVFFNDSDVGYNNELLDEFSISGFYWNLGAMYKHRFMTVEDGEIVPSGKSITVGVYGHTNNDITSTSNQFYRRINRFTTASDTLSFFEDRKSSITLPSTIGFGILYENNNKFRVGFDYAASKWSNYRNELKPDVLEDTYRVAAGAEFIPDYDSYNNYGKKMRYRIGAFYETDPRNINEQLTNYGITMGLGFPVILPRQQTSFFNLGLEIGQFGTETALQETYFKATFGFTLNDNSWFFKRKFQ